MIVVLRALKVGDLLVAVPALRAVRRHWPGHEVRLACRDALAPLAALTGCVDGVTHVDGLERLPEPLRGADVAVNLHGRGPESKRVVDESRPLRRIGFGGHGWPGPAWPEGVHERERWCAMLAAHGIPADPGELYLDAPGVPSPAPGCVVVHPGAAYGSKRWPVERWVEVVRTLRAGGAEVVVTGSAGERALAGELAARSGLGPAVILAGRTSLPELAALVAGAALVLSADTGIAHLGYAYRTPSVVLFGPVGAAAWGPPPGGPHVVLSLDAARRGDPFAADPDPALLGVGVADVVAAAESLLGVRAA